MSNSTFPVPILEHNYIPIRELGRGAFGVVFLARQRSLGREVVVKVLTARDPVARLRFHREARLLARLDHPRIVRLFDYGEHDEMLFMVHPFVPGRSLKDRILERGRLPWPEFVPLLRDIAAGLAAAHDGGVLHRDLKPDNILVTDTGSALVLDFGLGVAEDVTRYTADDEFLGTPLYLSPEMIRGDPVDGRSDLYALGFVIHVSLYGDHPFRAGNFQAVLMQHLNTEIEELPQVDPPVPPALEQLILALLEKNRDDRPSSAHRVLEELGRLPPGPTGSDRSPDPGPTTFARPGGAGTRKRTGAAATRASPLPTGPGAPTGEAGTVGTTDPGPALARRSRAGVLTALLAAVAAFLLAAWTVAPGDRVPERAPEREAVAPAAPVPGLGLLDLDPVATDSLIFITCRTRRPVVLHLEIRDGARLLSRSSDPEPSTRHRFRVPVPRSGSLDLSVRADGARIIPATLRITVPDRDAYRREATDLERMVRGLSLADQRFGLGVDSVLSRNRLRIKEIDAALATRSAWFWTDAGRKVLHDYLEATGGHPDSRPFYEILARALPGSGVSDVPLVEALAKLLDVANRPPGDEEADHAFRRVGRSIMVLRHLGGDRALDPLETFLADGWRGWWDRSPEIQAAVWLTRIDETIRHAWFHPDRAGTLRARLSDDPLDRVLRTVHELASGSKVEDQVRAALIDPEPRIRLALLRALAEPGVPGHRELLTAWPLEQENDALTLINGMFALGAHGGGPARAPLERALVSLVPGTRHLAFGPDHRILATRCLAMLPGTESFAMLRDRLAGETEWNQRAMVRSMADMAFRAWREGRVLDPGPLAVPDRSGDLHGGWLLLLAFTGDERFRARAREYLTAGTGYQRWVAATALAARGETLPADPPFPEDGTGLTPAAFRSRVDPVWNTLRRIAAATRSPGIRRELHLVDPIHHLVPTHFEAPAGARLRLTAAGMVTPREERHREVGSLDLSLANGNELQTLPEEIELVLSVGSSRFHVPTGPILSREIEVPEGGPIFLRALLTEHTDIDRDPHPHFSHAGLVLVRLEVDPRRLH